MQRNAFMILIADVVLLIALFYVFQDLEWRSGYAALPKMVCPQTCAYSPSSSYSILVQFFQMSGGPLTLTSPPTLDWVQVIVYALIILNGWLVYEVLIRRRASRSGSVVSSPQGPASVS